MRILNNRKIFQSVFLLIIQLKHLTTLPLLRYTLKKEVGMKKSLILGCLFILPLYTVYPEDVKTTNMVILEKRYKIDFVNLNDQTYISLDDLNAVLPFLFSINENGEILVNSDFLQAALIGFRSLNPYSSSSSSVIESRIDGDFEGWEGETIFKLMNGQIWQQVDYSYYYHYAFMPRVTIYKGSSGYIMEVDGTDRKVRVQRIK